MAYYELRGSNPLNISKNIHDQKIMMMMIMILMIMMFHINDLNEYDIDVECEAMSVILRQSLHQP